MDFENLSEPADPGDGCENCYLRDPAFESSAHGLLCSVCMEALEDADEPLGTVKALAPLDPLDSPFIP